MARWRPYSYVQCTTTDLSTIWCLISKATYNNIKYSYVDNKNHGSSTQQWPQSDIKRYEDGCKDLGGRGFEKGLLPESVCVHLKDMLMCVHHLALQVKACIRWCFGIATMSLHTWSHSNKIYSGRNFSICSRFRWTTTRMHCCKTSL